jgi:putative tricarboxylic transport membrane protein
VVGRPFAGVLDPIIKQPVVIEAKVGAAGQVGGQFAANAKPDGYTLLLHLMSISGFEAVDKLFGRKPKFPRADFIDVIRVKLRDLLPTRQEWREASMPIVRGSVLGFVVGIIPGSAHIISSFLSYALERRVAKNKDEFGKGAVAGVAGPESANNSASTGAFVPMLALGLPTGPITAVLIGALAIHGVAAGPQLVNEHPNIFWGFVASMYVGNLMLLALNLPLVGVFVSVLRIPYAYLYPLIIMFCIVGVYAVNNSIVDVWIMLIMGVVGYGLRKLSLDPAPLVLGLVIAPIFEMSLRQSLIMSNGNYLIFLQRPVSMILLGVSAGLLTLSAYSFFARRRDWRATLAEAEAGEAK